jgi:hypothetical protein
VKPGRAPLTGSLNDCSYDLFGDARVNIRTRPGSNPGGHGENSFFGDGACARGYCRLAAVLDAAMMKMISGRAAGESHLKI